MPSELELRRRIRSVRNVQQVTKAMQVVSAAKMRRAQALTLASRPFEERLRTVLNDLAPYADPEVDPLLARREVRRAAIILISTDRGLVGALNVNLLRAALRFAEQLPAVTYIPVGRKGIGALRRLRQPVTAEFSNLGDRPTTADTNIIARVAMEEFVAARVDEVHLAFTRFVHTMRQEPTVRRILPLAPQKVGAPPGEALPRRPSSLEEEDIKTPTRPSPELGPRGARLGALPPLQYIFEPDPATVLSRVLPRLIEISVYQVVLEALASEHSARMVAMRNATENAAELMDELTLAMNKARQWRITKEMLEIASGSEALAKG